MSRGEGRREIEIEKMMRNAYCVRRELGAGAGSEWVECRVGVHLSWLAARSSRLVARSFLKCLEGRTMCRKVVWLMAGLMGLVWLGGAAVAGLAGTR